jgi:hypothetical protein
MSLLASTVAAERDGETADDEAGHGVHYWCTRRKWLVQMQPFSGDSSNTIESLVIIKILAPPQVLFTKSCFQTNESLSTR